jgi:hypothetical protein
MTASVDRATTLLSEPRVVTGKMSVSAAALQAFPFSV